MIDYETDIFDAVADALTTAYPNITVDSVETFSPSSFPFVSIVEIDNSTYLRSRDSSNNENHANIAYEVNVFSNAVTGKKAECKSILNTLDAVMIRLGFTRINSSPVTLDDASKYRLASRYVATIGKNGVIFRR